MNFVKKKGFKGPPETDCKHCHDGHPWSNAECFRNPAHPKHDPTRKFCESCGWNKTHATAEHRGPARVRKRFKKKVHRANVADGKPGDDEILCPNDMEEQFKLAEENIANLRKWNLSRDDSDFPKWNSYVPKEGNQTAQSARSTQRILRKGGGITLFRGGFNATIVL